MPLGKLRPFSGLRPGFPAIALALLCSCNGGRDKLIGDLQSTRPDERATAVKKLADQGRSEDLVLFTQAAKDPVAIVRAEAITALGKSQDARVVDLLGEALGDPSEEVQAKAAMALAGIRSDKAKAYLTLQYSRRGRSTRLVIVQALKSSNVPGAMAGVVAAEAKSIWESNFQTLQDGSLPERVGAAEQLGKSGRPEAVNRLVPLIKDSQVMLAAAAVRGLGSAGDHRAVEPITRLLKENFPELREAACEALTQLKDPASLPALLEVALEKSPSSQLATAAIVNLPRSPQTDKALCDVTVGGGGAEVGTAGREMRRRTGCPLEMVVEKLKVATSIPAALAALAALGPTAKDAVPKVVPILTHSDTAIRKLAVDALVELGDPSVGPALLKLFETETKSLDLQRTDWVPLGLPLKYGAWFDPTAPVDERDPDAASRLKQTDLFRKVRALADAKAKEQGRVILEARPPSEIIDDASEPQLRVLAALVRALGLLKVEKAKAIAEKYVDESSASLRAAAFVSLAAQGPEGMKAAQPGLLDTEREVQAATAHAFAEAGEAGQTTLLGTLAQLTGDRSRLLEPFKSVIPARAGVPTLVQLVKEGGAEAGTAALLLGDMGATDAVDALLKTLEDPTCVVRREVIASLGKLKDPRAAAMVGKDLYNDSADVRAAAAEALATLGAGDHADALDALKGDYYRRVREAASATQARLTAKAKP
ncbi:MAG: lyase HEAT-like repeat protein [Myxococcaceae bacterium]|nr:lyase HEAT-like repeat protein [Myxococcaceae bacterium]